MKLDLSKATLRGPLFNDVTICGIAVDEPLKSRMDDGTATVSFTLACPARWVNKGGDERHKEMNITVRGWDSVAQLIYGNIQAGSGVLVQGRLAVHTHRDERGVEHETHYISARYVQFWIDGATKPKAGPAKAKKR